MVTFADATAADVPDMTELLNLLIRTPLTYTEQPYDHETTENWLSGRCKAGCPVFLAQVGTRTVGLASYAPFRSASGYRFTVEHSIYLSPNERGKGIARSLMQMLVERARKNRLRSLIGAIDGDNDNALKFHRKFGFKEVGRIPDAGFKLGEWRTLMLLQYRLGSA